MQSTHLLSTVSGWLMTAALAATWLSQAPDLPAQELFVYCPADVVDGAEDFTADLDGSAAEPGLAESELPDGTVGAVTADLKDRLEKDLKARRPGEFEFISRVIELVEDDKLPLSLVNRCYLWARRQPHRPFQYFQQAVIKQARGIGVDI